MSSITLSPFPSLVNALAPQLSGSNGPAIACETLYFWLDTATLSDVNRLYRSASTPGFASRRSWCSLPELASSTLFPSGPEAAGCATVGTDVSTAARDASRQPLIPIPVNKPIRSAAPQAIGIQMRRTSAFSSRKRASTVLARLIRALRTGSLPALIQMECNRTGRERSTAGICNRQSRRQASRAGLAGILSGARTPLS